MSFFSEIFKDLSKVPGSPEAITSALSGGLNGSLSWNPFSKSNSVWDTGAGGTQLSQNPTDRAIGRTIGSYFAGGALGGALGGSGTTAADAGSGIGSFAADGSYIPAAGGDTAGLTGNVFANGGASDLGTFAADGSYIPATGADPFNLSATSDFDGGAQFPSVVPSSGTDVGTFAPDGTYIPPSGTNVVQNPFAQPGAQSPLAGPTTPATNTGTINDPGAPGNPTTNPTTTPTGAPTTNAPAGNQSWLQKALGNNKLQTAQLGLGTLGLINQVKQGSNAQKQMNAIAGPASQASQQLLAQFKAGQINPSDAYAIQQWQQTQQAQSDQYFAQAGLSNSSMHQQASSQIAAQAEAMRQQAVQNLLTQGLQAAGVANPTLQAGVTAGLQQDNAAMTTMNNFLATLAKMNTGGGSGGGSNTQTQTGTPNG